MEMVRTYVGSICTPRKATRRSSCENTKRLNTVIATLPTAALQSKVQTLQSQRKHSASARSAIKTGEELKEVRALLKVSACRPRLVVAQSMNGRSGHGTTHVDEVDGRSLGLGAPSWCGNRTRV